MRCNHFRFRLPPLIFYDAWVILTRTLQNLAATKTFFRLAEYDRVKAEALQLSVEDVEIGAKRQVLDSAKLLVNERKLPPCFVMEQLMFWDHQPQRRSDVLCFQGAVELPCPTNIMRCCTSAGGLPSEDFQHIQDLLAGRFIQKKSRIIPSLKFAANLADTFFGCTALDTTIRQLQESPVLKNCTQLFHPVLTDSATGKLDQSGNQWFQADRILQQRRVAGSAALEYLVRWCGNPPQPDSWELRKNINDALFAQWRIERRSHLTPHTSHLTPHTGFSAPSGHQSALAVCDSGDAAEHEAAFSILGMSLEEAVLEKVGPKP